MLFTLFILMLQNVEEGAGDLKVSDADTLLGQM